jgi:hypothetical protein
VSYCTIKICLEDDEDCVENPTYAGFVAVLIGDWFLVPDLGYFCADNFTPVAGGEGCTCQPRD